MHTFIRATAILVGFALFNTGCLNITSKEGPGRSPSRVSPDSVDWNDEDSVNGFLSQVATYASSGPTPTNTGAVEPPPTPEATPTQGGGNPEPEGTARGDLNSDGKHNISDVTRIGRAYLDPTSVPCQATADVNNDGRITITDVVRLGDMTAYLYSGGPRPAFMDEYVADEDCQLVYVKGDLDNNGKIDISDVIRAYTTYRTGGANLECQAAGDTDSNGTINITDLINQGGGLYRFLFMGGKQPFPFSQIAKDDCDL